MGKAAGGVRFISLCGFGRLEKSVKIQRYFEILKYIASLLKNEWVSIINLMLILDN